MNPTGALANSKTAVKKLKNKRLTDFINDVAATIPDPGQASDKIRRYKPYSLIDLEREHILKQYQLGDDEPPLLFVGRRPLKLRADSHQLSEIVNSYMAFKELTIESDYQQDECSGFV